MVKVCVFEYAGYFPLDFLRTAGFGFLGVLFFSRDTNDIYLCYTPFFNNINMILVDFLTLFKKQPAPDIFYVFRQDHIFAQIITVYNCHSDSLK
ncbi:hypothetical protein PITCH_A780038 [uncultured Desulfobacterium sp.]|uniref:Uncharacterized protein n=1 Tax=uncultured Desulfobacterium sp. TaxID=201089 RepID=A0A445N2I0_9BACT|nr:hypothetical protein PITCH_A780038 [uncultured Desulfobacterium sp.]